MSATRSRPTVVLIGPPRTAVGGITTHINQLLGSGLGDSVELLHFPVGSGGPQEPLLLKLLRLATSPFCFLRLLLVRRPSIVHLNTSMVPKAFWRDALYVLIARLLGCKVMVQVHGGALPHEFFRGRPLLNRLLARFLCASEVVVLLARVELDAYHRFVPGARLELVTNGIDARSLTREAVAAKPPGALHLAYVGRLAEEKGIFDAVEALAILARAKRAVRLSLAGSGPEEKRLRTRVANLGLDDRVQFLGPLFDARKEALWRSAHVFVLPSYFEGLPYALLEAMASGTVPVATRVGAVPDVVEDGVHGVLVPVRDPRALAAAIARLDGDRAGLARMAEAGRRRVMERHTLARFAEDFRNLYSSVLQG